MRAHSAYGEFSLICVGAVAGFSLAWWLHGFDFGSAHELADARAAGIVSRTVLAGYAKSRDVHNYVLALLLPVVGALAVWWAAGVRSSLGGQMLAGGFDKHGLQQRLLWPFLALVTIASWHSTEILLPPWNPYVGAWPFLGEQGATLAWLQSLDGGGVFGRDFFSLYGPMFIYPLSWLMDISGNYAAVVERYYKFGLQIAAFALLTLMLLRSLRSPAIGVCFALAIAAAHAPLIHPSANTNVLRVALPLFALGAIALWVDTRSQRWLWAGGLAIGQAFLFSQEAAVSALVAACTILYLDAWQSSGRHVRALRNTAVVVGIALLSMAPMLAYLLALGAGPALVDSMFGYPRLVLLGFGALPFPSLRDWFPANMREHAVHYTVIGLYAGSAIAVALVWFKGTRSPRLLWALGLTVFGVVLFRQALGRSAAEQTIKVMLPAVFLAALWLDAAWYRVRAGLSAGAPDVVAAIAGALVLASVIAGIGLDPEVRHRILSAWLTGTTLDGKFATDPKLNRQTFHPRIGFALDPLTELSVAEIGEFLDRKTKPGEAVYFFPNEAAYYYVFDRPNPTRYAIAYLAASFERQREVTKDLEVGRPRYVVFSKRTWRVDNIPETQQVPLIVDYLRKNYRATGLSLETVEIYERI